LVHFDFDDRYQDELVVGNAISRREGVLLSVGAHVLVLLLILFGDRIPFLQPSPEELEQQRQELIRQQQEERNRQRMVFVQPRVDLESRQARERADLSDINRMARSPATAPAPENPLPFSKGNSSEMNEPAAEARPAGPEAPTPEPPQPEREAPPRVLPDDTRGQPRPPDVPAPPRAARGALGEALRDLQRYVQSQTFNNPQGGRTDPGSSIQFDTKGVEFGPWIRRFVNQIRRNWFVPNAAMTFRGRVVLQFNIHRSGRITDIAVVEPSSVNAFNTAAYNAILGSSPTEPLPPEYPEEKALFTVTFYYNEPVN
jgi:TonB family protein